MSARALLCKSATIKEQQTFIKEQQTSISLLWKPPQKRGGQAPAGGIRRRRRRRGVAREALAGDPAPIRPPNKKRRTAENRKVYEWH